MTKSETSPFCTEWIGFVVIFWHRHSEFEVLSFFGFMFEFKLFEFNCEDCVNNVLLSRTKWYKILYKSVVAPVRVNISVLRLKGINAISMHNLLLSFTKTSSTCSRFKLNDHYTLLVRFK